MENLTKVANALFTSKPELELLKIWGDLMNRNNLALNTEQSEQCQTLVVDAYYGIQQKLGRTKIDGELLQAAFADVVEMLSFGEEKETKLQETVSNIMQGIATGKIKVEGLGDVNLAQMFADIQAVASEPNLATKEDVELYNQKIEEFAKELVTSPVLADTEAGVKEMGKVVQMPVEMPQEQAQTVSNETVEATEAVEA